MRRPRRSTLFPYTTLFRSVHERLMIVRLQPQRLGVFVARLREQPVGFLPSLRLSLVGQCIAPVVERSMIVRLQPQRLGALAARLRKEPVGFLPRLRRGLVVQRNAPVVERLMIVRLQSQRLGVLDRKSTRLNSSHLG